MALQAYTDRPRHGSLDSPLLGGTSKDLLEATAAHVLVQKQGSYSSTSNFPTLLDQASTTLGLAPPGDPVVASEPPNMRMERASYDLACASNALRNKQGTDHDRPWIGGLTLSQARFPIVSMGNIASLMLDALTA